MPGMSGFELLAHIRDHEEWQYLPVIAVTAHSMSGDEQRIRDAGFDGYIPKPINAMTLIDEINRFLEQRK
jgi:two-component system, cell cycle response regulator DivK